MSFARLVPAALFGLFAGVAADRRSRKRVMIAAYAVRAVAVASLVAASAGALRAVAPLRQLPAAAGAQGGRQAAVQLAGPPLGGSLFALGRVESVRSTISLLIAPLGPLVAGALLGSVSARAAIAVFVAFALVLAAWGTSSRSIRDAPRLDELDAVAA